MDKKYIKLLLQNHDQIVKEMENTVLNFIDTRVELSIEELKNTSNDVVNNFFKVLNKPLKIEEDELIVPSIGIINDEIYLYISSPSRSLLPISWFAETKTDLIINLLKILIEEK